MNTRLHKLTEQLAFPSPENQVAMARIFNHLCHWDIQEHVFQSLLRHRPGHGPTSTAILDIKANTFIQTLKDLSMIINIQHGSNFHANLKLEKLRPIDRATFMPGSVRWRYFDLNPQSEETTVQEWECEKEMANFTFLYALIYKPTLVKDLRELGYYGGIWLGGWRTKENQVAHFGYDEQSHTLEINPASPGHGSNNRCIPITVG